MSKLRGGPTGESGQALAIVTAFLAAMFLVPIFVTAIAINQNVTATHQVDAETAFGAAEAGLSDYVNSFVANPSFPAQSAAVSKYAAFGSTTGTPTWEPVPGSATECFWYRTGTFTGTSATVTVTGRIGAASLNCAGVRTGTYLYKTIGATVTVTPAGKHVTIVDDDSDDPDDDAVSAPPTPPQVGTLVWTQDLQCPTGTLGPDGQEQATSSCP